MKILRCVFLLLIIGHFNNSWAKEADTRLDVQQVKQKAKQLNLADSPAWLALLHYTTEILSRRIVSQVDDGDFFLAEDGNENAESELLADLDAFLRPKPVSRDTVHAQCLFPARWFWLKQQLGLPDIDDVPCYRLQVFIDEFETDYLTLVFPSMYLNNPGSTFGHTFLRFDGNNQSVLFSQTLNYAAKTDKSDSLPIYVEKGLFGGYRGIFRTRKYFETVQEYSNIENRDIWEYRLNFSPAEIRQLVRHVWEVKGIDFDYYFFRENCAYRLLALLDAVRPEPGLTSGNAFMLYAIPVDTVRALDEHGMIDQRNFRPSLATGLKQFYAQASETVADDVTRLADKETSIDDIVHSNLADSDKATVLHQAYALLQFRGDADQPYAESMLSALSQFNNETDTHPGSAKSETSQPIPPENGHHSSRFAIGAGEQLNSAYVNFRLRPAFHDLLDNPDGYVPGADINVLDTQLKYFIEDHHLRLEQLRLFNITSLSPVSQWYKPASWLLDIRIDRTSLSETRSVQTFLVRGGGGYSTNWDIFMPYLLLTGEWNLSKQYEKGYSLYLGGQLGSLIHTRFGQGQISAERAVAVSGFERDKTFYQAAWQFDMNINTALRFSYRKIHYPEFDDNDWAVDINWYF